MKKTVTLFLLICSFFLSTAQKKGQSRIDSLMLQIPKAIEDTNKIKLLNNLSGTYYNMNPDSGLKYAKQAVALSEKLIWKKGLMVAFNWLGINYRRKANFDTALYYNLKSLKLAKEIDNKRGIAAACDAVATVYYDIPDYPKALDYFTQTYNVYEELGNKQGMGELSYAIGAVYINQSDYPRALDYFLKSLKISEDLGLKSDISSALGAIGTVYSYQEDTAKAIDYYKQALKIDEEIGNNYAIGVCLENIGNLYIGKGKDTIALTYLKKALALNLESKYNSGIGQGFSDIGQVYLSEKKYALALDYFFKAEEYGKASKDELVQGGTLSVIAKTYLSLHDMRKAKSYADSSITVLKKINALKPEESEAYKTSADASELMGDYKAALENYKSYAALKDSVFNTEKNKKLTQLSMQYDFNKKHATDSLQFASQTQIENINLNKQKMFTSLGFLGMALVVLLLFFVYRNYANQRKSNAELQIARNNALEQKDRAERSEAFKQQFLANMSHEIRTPMNAVSGMTDLLLDKSPQPEQVKYLDAISKSSTTLLHIINDILDLSKIEAGKMDLEAIDFSISDILNQVKDILSYKAEEKGLSFIIDVASDITDVVVGDPYRLTQILTNLGGNAVKFTEKGSVEIKVENYGSSIKFSIIDTGIGIPADKLNSLFENFTQVSSSDSRKYGGTGLGLSISKKLIELQGGTITVESEAGRGTTFSFVINYLKGSPEKLQQRIANEQKVDGSVLDGLRILLADDNEYNRMVAEETLMLKAKVTIDSAVNGQEAIDLLEQHVYDVVLMDIQMPVMNGYEASKYIRETLKSNIPIIALTASVLRVDLDKCIMAGMNSYLPKPFRAWQLIGTIAEATGRKNQQTIKQKI